VNLRARRTDVGALGTEIIPRLCRARGACIFSGHTIYILPPGPMQRPGGFCFVWRVPVAAGRAVTMRLRACTFSRLREEQRISAWESGTYGPQGYLGRGISGDTGADAGRRKGAL
jgi:hypothetical protein